MSFSRPRSVLASALLTGLVVSALPGCGDGKEVSQAPPSVELKASESKYGAQIDKNKAEAKDKAKEKAK